MIPSTTDLYYFQMAATELHFSHAAQKLNVTQPSLSIAIKRLEDLLGLSLFIRHKKGVTLTKAGEELHQVTQTMLTQWDNAIANIKAANQAVKGVVKIGCHSTLIPYMSGMVSELLKQYPSLEIHFQHDISPKLLEYVIQGRCDIGILTNPDPHPDVILQKIADSEFGYFVSKDHQDKFNLHSEKTIFICHPELPQTQYLIKALLKKIGHANLKKNTINHIETIAHMTVEGYGIGILPVNYTHKFFSDKLILVADTPLLSTPLCLAYRPESKLVNAIQIVLNAIREIAKQSKASTFSSAPLSSQLP